MRTPGDSAPSPSSDCCGASAVRRRRPLPGLLGVVGGIALLCVPKCPMCIAAYLAAVGLGSGLAHAVQPWLGPLGVTLMAVGVGLAVKTSGVRRAEVSERGSARARPTHDA